MHGKKTRSYNMSRIRSKDTKPELLVRKYLHSCGLRYRLHHPKLPGRPDLVLKKYKTTIFVNGCFWHGHKNCKYFKLPKTRTELWEQKISKTKYKDELAKTDLEEKGWQVLVIWECQLNPQRIAGTMAEVVDKVIQHTKHQADLHG